MVFLSGKLSYVKSPKKSHKGSSMLVLMRTDNYQGLVKAEGFSFGTRPILQWE